MLVFGVMQIEKMRAEPGLVHTVVGARVEGGQHDARKLRSPLGRVAFANALPREAAWQIDETRLFIDIKIPGSHGDDSLIVGVPKDTTARVRGRSELEACCGGCCQTGGDGNVHCPHVCLS